MNLSIQQQQQEEKYTAVSLVLTVIGMIVLVGSLLRLDLGILFNLQITGELFVLIPGILMILLGVQKGKSGQLLTVTGTMAVVTALILLFQQVTGMYQIWLYAWLLVAPTAHGLGRVIHGTYTDDETLSDSGYRFIGAGIVLFQLAFFFCELILGISGFGLFNSGMVMLVTPAAVVMLGFVVKLHYEDRMDVQHRL